MSFGFSVSDFALLAKLAWQLYGALKDGLAERQAFSREVLSFHQVLEKVTSNLEAQSHHLNSVEQATLNQYAMECNELLCSKIFSDVSLQSMYEYPDIYDPDPMDHPRGWRGRRINFSHMCEIKGKVRSANFARKIPKLQRAITAQVEKLTAYNVLLVQSSQARMEESHIRLESRIERHQIHMESLLKDYLATQKYGGTQSIPNSWDSSSPESVSACKGLYRALRKEGINHEIIRNNTQLLVNVMKSTMGTSEEAAQSVASTLCESFRIAPEFNEDATLSAANSTTDGEAAPLTIMSVGTTPSPAHSTMRPFNIGSFLHAGLKCPCGAGPDTNDHGLGKPRKEDSYDSTSLLSSAPPATPSFPQHFIECQLERFSGTEEGQDEDQDDDQDVNQNKFADGDTWNQHPTRSRNILDDAETDLLDTSYN